ncbi:hypothetical protein L2E82_38150 [Cichorium intybus]|uniref:Uncharacterized protein n=1 Tax=Cichorium intybus TaxID=13427 RepID=A0ACB9AGG3_CICIN|nr:hypothetical protein L2E82_38150 [Cichorium intybus]
MAEVVVGLDSILTLQQKINSSLQTGKTIFGRMLDIFPYNGENSGYGNKDFTFPILSLKVFKFSDLEKTTRNFSQDLLIGRDGYGEVFIGWVDGKTFAPSRKGFGIAVAVKRYFEGLRELETLATCYGQLGHPNIISLLGYCDDKNQNCLLVYEDMHMHNRNFSHFLFGDVTEPLSWGARLTIMIGVARGLAYLHSSKEQVIHGGIKTFNVLLDQNFNAKLGHFGSDQFYPKIQELDGPTRDMDTLRYFDRGDQLDGCVTMAGDVYSFGNGMRSLYQNGQIHI